MGLLKGGLALRAPEHTVQPERRCSILTSCQLPLSGIRT